MFANNNVLAVVPARSGSRGVPHKNVHALAGVSLIGRAGNCLAQLPWLDAKVITTDSPDYVAEAERFGLAAPFLRPAELSTDAAGAIETVQHAVRECERHYAKRFDVILIVEPTSPLRQPADLEACVRCLIETGAGSVVTVSHVDAKFHPWKLLTRSAENRIHFHQDQGASVQNRQALPGRFVYRNGVCYALTRRCLMDDSRIFGEHTEAVLINRPIVNIDDPLDIKWAEFLLLDGVVPDMTRSPTPPLRPGCTDHGSLFKSQQ